MHARELRGPAVVSRGSFADLGMFPVNTDHVTILQYYACLWLVNPFLASRPFVLGPLAPRYGDATSDFGAEMGARDPAP